MKWHQRLALPALEPSSAKVSCIWICSHMNKVLLIVRRRHSQSRQFALSLSKGTPPGYGHVHPAQSPHREREEGDGDHHLPGNGRRVPDWPGHR